MLAEERLRLAAFAQDPAGRSGAIVIKDGSVVPPGDLEIVPGPGARPTS
jgi:hypothetical protein